MVWVGVLFVIPAAHPVIPAHAGISWRGLGGCAVEIPAYAGMTELGAVPPRHSRARGNLMAVPGRLRGEDSRLRGNDGSVAAGMTELGAVPPPSFALPPPVIPAHAGISSRG